MKGQHCSWVDMQKIREALSTKAPGSQKHLTHLRCVDKGTVSRWRQVCDLMDAVDGKVAVSQLEHVQPSHYLEIVSAVRRDHGPVADWPEEVVDTAVDLIDQCEEGELTVRDLRRELASKAPRKSPPPLPKGTYNVWLADPPWRYEFARGKSREIESHYGSMTVNDICTLELPTAPAAGAVLFLWATAPQLIEALQVMQAWGFTYRTHMIWDKVKIGMGYWCRGRHELLLIGSLGDFKPPAEKDRPPSLFMEERTRHSAKPDCAYRMIESMFPNSSRVELFARKARKGWTSWGNQVGS